MVNYHFPITLKEVKKSPPFHNMPLLPGEHNHDWDITVIEFGGKNREVSK